MPAKYAAFIDVPVCVNANNLRRINVFEPRTYVPQVTSRLNTRLACMLRWPSKGSNPGFCLLRGLPLRSGNTLITWGCLGEMCCHGFCRWFLIHDHRLLLLTADSMANGFCCWLLPWLPSESCRGAVGSALAMPARGSYFSSVAGMVRHCAASGASRCRSPRHHRRRGSKKRVPTGGLGEWLPDRCLEEMDFLGCPVRSHEILMGRGYACLRTDRRIHWAGKATTAYGLYPGQHRKDMDTGAPWIRNLEKFWSQSERWFLCEA